MIVAFVFGFVIAFALPIVIGNICYDMALLIIEISDKKYDNYRTKICMILGIVFGIIFAFLEVILFA